MEPTGRRPSQGWQWGTGAIAATAMLALPFSAAASIEAQPAEAPQMGVIVQELPGTGDGPERAVARLGGSVTRQLGLIDGFSARIPSGALSALRGVRGVREVTPDAKITLNEVDGFDQKSDKGSLYNTVKVTRADNAWSRGYTGQGVDVAVLDSGAAPVEGLNASGKVFYGPDLSFESQFDNVRNLDTFGHGTHMAGIIAGRDNAAAVADPRDDKNFRGIAPNARIVSVKVADRTGAADVSQVIAGIDWIVQNRKQHGLNIRVLNLSFGTDGVQDYKIDPLAFAAEMAWHKGIVVVVSGGNAGFGSAKLNNPAYNPYVIAVGASDPNGTAETNDDTVPAWSSAGDGLRNPDLVAPGKSIVSLRIGGGGIDSNAPHGRVGNGRFFRGSGTSQAAAVVSGGVALLLSQRPGLAPDQVKHILKKTADPLPNADQRAQGAGALDLQGALMTRTPRLRYVAQTWPRSTGTGSLDAARGTQRLEHEGQVLDGERDIFGNPWDGRSWSNDAWNGVSWSGGDWRGVSWTGASWSGASWSGASWSGASWSGASWSGASWSGASWSGASWSGASWSGASWSGASWSGASWSGKSWSSADWGA